jgi:hypothetical protein
MTMQLIETKTLGAAAALIEFTSIPQTFTDLLLLISARGTNASTEVEGFLTFNGSSADFSSRVLYGNPPGGNAVSFTGGYTAGPISANSSTANTFANTSVYIPNYSGSANKSFSVDSVNENNATTAFTFIVSGLWSNTAAITSIGIQATPGNLNTGTTASLYGITKGSDGIVTTS